MFSPPVDVLFWCLQEIRNLLRGGVPPVRVSASATAAAPSTLAGGGAAAAAAAPSTSGEYITITDVKHPSCS